jgi:hypothetical protein
MKKSAKQLAARIALSIKNSAKLSEAECSEIAFHSTDWLDELELLCSTFDSIESLSDEEIYNNLLRFLIHAPEHIAKAAELMTGTGVEGIFSDSDT